MKVAVSAAAPSLDAAVTLAQVARRTVVENGEGPAAADIRPLWGRVQHELA